MEKKSTKLAHRVEQALADMGICQLVRTNGKAAYKVPPSFSRVVWKKSGQGVALHLDVNHLPRMVSLDTLSSPETVDALRLALQAPVRVLNGKELIYVITVAAEPAKIMA